MCRGTGPALQHRFAGPRRARRVFHIQRTAHHFFDDLFARDLAYRAFAHHAAVAQNGHRVANAENLIQLMGNVNHGNAVSAQLFNDGEEHFHFLARQRGGGLVHNNDLGVEGKRLGDFYQLLFRRGKFAHDAVYVEGKAQAIQKLARLNTESFPIDSFAAIVAAQKDVFRHGKRVDEVEFLENNAQALFLRSRTPCRSSFSPSR